MKIEVLVATMHQTNHTLPERMNLQTDAVIVNQCDRSNCEILEYKGHRVVWVDTTQRGLSRSRNMALSYAQGDICLLADDDISYVDGYHQIVEDAFTRESRADIIAFNFYAINDGHLSARKEIRENGKASGHSYYGSVRLAFKRGRLQKYCLHFNEIFGAGAKYSSGEESLFLRECRKKGLQIYKNKAFLCTVDYSTSTWFEGYNEKFYFNKGVFLAAAYGKWAHFFKLYFLLQSKKISKLSMACVNGCISEGIKEFKTI